MYIIRVLKVCGIGIHVQCTYMYNYVHEMHVYRYYVQCND